MNKEHADHETDPHAHPQDGQHGQSDTNRSILRSIWGTFCAVVAVYVEIFLFCAYAQEHWNDLWFKIVAGTIPIANGIAVYGVLVGVVKWRQIPSTYAGTVVFLLIGLALLSSYIGVDVLKSHPRTVAYLLASVITVELNITLIIGRRVGGRLIR
jgi:hypothetical protein